MMGCAPPRLLLGCALVLLPLSLQSHGRVAAADWRVCDVRDHGAVGDGLSSDSVAIRSALDVCDEVVLPAAHTFLSGPLNLTSNQRLNVQGTLLASVDKADYPLVLPMTGYGWGDDENCFPPNVDRHKIIIGSLRYSPVIGSYNASNVSVVGSGTIDGRGEIWWQNCTACHYPPHNQSSFCEIASRPKLLEFQFVHGLQVQGESAGAALHLKDSPFWTLTPSYSEDVHVANLRITAPMDRIGNTDGVNIDSCRRVLVENV
jgi:polygalacturonase